MDKTWEKKVFISRSLRISLQELLIVDETHSTESSEMPSFAGSLFLTSWYFFKMFFLECSEFSSVIICWVCTFQLTKETQDQSLN